MILLCLYCFATRTEFRFIYHLHFLNISLSTLRMRNMCTRHSSASCHSQLVSCHWATFRVATSRRIVRQTVASFSSVLLPRPRWTHAAQSLALSTSVCSTIFSINIFLSLPFSIFYFLLQAFLCVFVALFGAFEMQFPKKYSTSRVSKYATTDCADCADSFLEELEVFMSPYSVWQSVKAVHTVYTHFE